MLNLGPLEMIVLMGIAALLFGIIIAFVAVLIFGNRLPGVMRSLGKSVAKFKKGVSGIEDDIDQAVTADKKTPPSP